MGLVVRFPAGETSIQLDDFELIGRLRNEEDGRRGSHELDGGGHRTVVTA